MTDKTHNGMLIDLTLEKFETLAIPYHGLINTPNTIGLFEGEARRLLYAACESDPTQTWVNIGSNNGGSDVLLMLMKEELTDVESNFISVDIQFSPFMSVNVDRILGRDEKVKHYLIQHSSSDFSQIYSNTFKDKKISLVFIDGFHSFKRVVEDTKQILPHLVDGAIICYNACSPLMNDKGRRIEAFKLFDHKKCEQLFESNKEDFYIDEALFFLMQSIDTLKYFDIPINLHDDYRQRTRYNYYIRGETSPHNSLHALVFRETN